MSEEAPKKEPLEISADLSQVTTEHLILAGLVMEHNNVPSRMAIAKLSRQALFERAPGQGGQTPENAEPA